MSNDHKSPSQRGVWPFISFLTIGRVFTVAHRLFLLYDEDVLDRLGMKCDIFFLTVVSIFGSMYDIHTDKESL